ncbi:MAG: NUDIX domain-containing protein [Anaerolineaceae bacterium]|nr:MAG: NUDIX domain-containing protein [Anaerolineaceae bacterium]
MEEQFDVINEQDEVIGQAARSEVHAQGLWHRGVHIFLFTLNGRMLVQQRSADRKQYASLWDCSVSEHVKAGEDYVTAAQRGLWEELGLRDVTLTPRLRFRLNYGPNDNEISLLFTGTADPARIRFDPVEIARVDTLSMTELLDRAGSDDANLCYWFIQLLKWYTGDESDLIPLQTDFR